MKMTSRAKSEDYVESTAVGPRTTLHPSVICTPVARRNATSNSAVQHRIQLDTTSYSGCHAHLGHCSSPFLLRIEGPVSRLSGTRLKSLVGFVCDATVPRISDTAINPDVRSRESLPQLP